MHERFLLILIKIYHTNRRYFLTKINLNLILLTDAYSIREHFCMNILSNFQTKAID